MPVPLVKGLATFLRAGLIVEAARSKVAPLPWDLGMTYGQVSSLWQEAMSAPVESSAQYLNRYRNSTGRKERPHPRGRKQISSTPLLKILHYEDDLAPVIVYHRGGE